jgi:hypothetical protein
MPDVFDLDYLTPEMSEQAFTEALLSKYPEYRDRTTYDAFGSGILHPIPTRMTSGACFARFGELTAAAFRGQGQITHATEGHRPTVDSYGADGLREFIQRLLERIDESRDSFRVETVTGSDGYRYPYLVGTVASPAGAVAFSVPAPFYDRMKFFAVSDPESGDDGLPGHMERIFLRSIQVLLELVKDAGFDGALPSQERVREILGHAA